MVRFRFIEQDFFEADPVRYRAALGDRLGRKLAARGARAGDCLRTRAAVILIWLAVGRVLAESWRCANVS